MALSTLQRRLVASSSASLIRRLSTLHGHVNAESIEGARACPTDRNGQHHSQLHHQHHNARQEQQGGRSGARVAASSIGAAAFASAALLNQTAACSEAAAGDKTALNPQQFVSFKLKEVLPVSQNTNIYRFELPPDVRLGLTVASCLVTRAPIGSAGEDGKPKNVIRPYTPITQPDVTGHFDLLVKVYPQGKLSRHFDSLKPGDTLEFKGPIPKLPYTPNMKRQIGMIAGGTGITPMLQVIDAILNNPTDDTQVSLIYANVSPADILLKAKLDEYAAAHPNFKVFYVVDKGDEKWQGGVGFITADVLKKSLPTPSHDSLILVCGPPGLMKHVSGDKAPDKSQGELDGLLKNLGYDKDNVYKF